MKSLFVVLRFTLFSLIRVVLSEENLNRSLYENPEVESKWQMTGSFGWYLEGQDFHRGVAFQNNNEDIILSSSVASLLLICSAHYPIYWTHDLQTNIEQRSSPTTYLHRISDDFSDPHTYKFYAYLWLSTQSERYKDYLVSTGRYTCKSVSARDNELQTTRFIFSQGATRSMVYGEGVKSSSSTPFYHNHEYGYSDHAPACTTPSCNGFPSKTVQADKDNQTIILPCAVNSPLTKIKLYKKSQEDYKEIEWINTNTTTGITFDPKIGFILNVTEQVTPPYGVYKCTPDNLEVLIVNVTMGLAETFKGENDTLSGHAKYFYDTTAHAKFGDRIACCSNGAKPPRIYTKSCSTKYDCETARKQLQDFWYFDEKDVRSGNCRSYGVRSLDPLNAPSPVTGVFRCVGDGIDVTREYYIPPTSNNSAIYYNDDIFGLDKSDLIIFSASGDGIERLVNIAENEMTAYTNQSLNLICHPSTYLFALGVRWSITWQNKTTQLVPTNGEYVISENIGAELTNKLNIKEASDILAVTCHAPLYNTFEWFNKTLRFRISDAEAPKIIGPETERLHWVIGVDKNKSLTCEASGVPTPTFTWEEPKSDQAERSYYTDSYQAYQVTRAQWREHNYNKEIVRGERTSTIRFKEVLPTMDGTYVCTASSIPALGSATKTFIVSVSDKRVEVNGYNSSQPEVHLSEPEIDHDHSDIQGLTTGMLILLCVCVSAVTIVFLIAVGLIWRKIKNEEAKKLNKVSYQDLKEMQEWGSNSMDS